MTPEKIQEITFLAEQEFKARQTYENLGMMNTPTEPDKRLAAAVRYALARAEWNEAKQKLEEAI